MYGQTQSVCGDVLSVCTHFLEPGYLPWREGSGLSCPNRKPEVTGYPCVCPPVAKGQRHIVFHELCSRILDPLLRASSRHRSKAYYSSHRNWPIRASSCALPGRRDRGGRRLARETALFVWSGRRIRLWNQRTKRIFKDFTGKTSAWSTTTPMAKWGIARRLKI